jgi:hypothetical protein
MHVCLEFVESLDCLFVNGDRGLNSAGVLVVDKVEVERQYQQLCESWRMELEEKQKQFDEARQQIMQPRCDFLTPLHIAPRLT